MSHISIFLDESGDLGFDFSKNKTSKVFVLNLLVCADLQALASFKHAVRRTLKNKVKQKKKNKDECELKASKTSLEVKKYFFKQLPQTGWGIYSYILNKNRVYDYLKTPQNKHRLYNFISGKLLGKISFGKNTGTVNLVIDRSKAPDEVAEFNDYLRNQIESKIPLSAVLKISHLKSEASPGIQAIDLFSWGIYRKYNSGDEEWYNVFKDRIVFEDIYLK